jgi:Cdc6-like AAA superfamily ATPase
MKMRSIFNKIYENKEKIVESFDNYCINGNHNIGPFKVIDTLINEISIPRMDTNPVIFYSKVAFKCAVEYRKWSISKDRLENGQQVDDPLSSFLVKNGFVRMHENSDAVSEIFSSLIVNSKSTIIKKFNERGSAGVSDSSDNLYILEKEEFSIALQASVFNLKMYSYKPIYIKGCFESAFRWIKEQFWKDAQNGAVITKTSKNANRDCIILEAKDLSPKFLSTSSCDEDNIYDSLRKRMISFYNSGIRRSVLLHGLPGTGKSTFARSVFVGKNLNVLALDVESAAYDTTLTIIKIINPDVIIFDDMDRDPDRASEVLSFMEYIQCPLVIASVNDISALDHALLRPGRFDEIYEILPPEKQTRIDLINYYAKKFSVTEYDEAYLSEKTDGFTHAEICELITSISMSDFDTDREISRILKQKSLLGAVSLSQKNLDYARRDTDKDLTKEAEYIEYSI